ncbi:di-heme-cytochrome C peroxidase [Geminocystis sp. NIES-3709]|uniref:di-heme-cytochrome C peroxidase n=1 Tax=Geminocystis sp. NIES-3709 TaxID=1617448 RepID=UPI0005FC4BCD|nr:di-heme-cytochrome C peroxidase [Geminocystis sp. NIES-3709]BAQ67148.1 hypothetical protein GM3709_3913 [Geminocystis sp. NIES-3709]
MFYKIFQCFFIFGLSLCLIYSEAFANVKPQVAELNQGWSEQEVQFYNHASEGTNLAPLEFVLNLPDPKAPDSKFIDKLSSEYGFIPSNKSELNPYQLPVGFAIDKRPVKFGDRPYLGVTCAACHTRQLTYSKIDSSSYDSEWIFPVHGGPSLVDFPRFQEDLYDSFLALLDDDVLMETFATAVLQRAPEQQDIDSLRDEIREFTGPFIFTREIINGMKIPEADSGPGNLNALTQGYYNNVGILGWMRHKGLIKPGGELPLPVRLEGAVNYPPVWFSPKDTWAQWFAEIHHPGPRNWIQSISTSAVRPPKMIEALKEKAVLASIDFDNIEEIQDSLERLRTPKWPESALGQLDQKLIAQGKVLFEQNCAQCHTRTYEPPNSLGIKFKKRLAFDVGTDPIAYQQFQKDASKRAEGLLNVSNKILELRQGQLEEKFGEEVTGNYLKHDSRGRPNEFALTKEGEYSSASPKDKWNKSGAVYWAPPMEGIFASSPYFHNGSVPTLWDVLSKPEKRPTTFQTGTNEFDPEHIGLKNEGLFLYNTKEEGKDNNGHLFGTNLPPKQKLALLEYLKSI